VRSDELLAIDVAAEVATLCATQVQGPWQVPAELVRLAVARGAARVDVDRVRGGLRLRCAGRLADQGELRDLALVFDPKAERGDRQAAISRSEAAGLQALMWAAGQPGARLVIEVYSGDDSAVLEVRDAGVRVGRGAVAAPPGTTVVWRCRGMRTRRALAWLETACRFVPVPISVAGCDLPRGFEGGLYRMRLAGPLATELAITAAGDTPSLWLLEHGVLSARAVVPGYPAFSAAIELSGVAPPASSADALRAAADPYLAGLLDQAARMLVLLVDRLPTVDEPVRTRLTSLLLGFAVRDILRHEIESLPVVAVRRAGSRRFVTPARLARWARRRGGVVVATEPGQAGGDPAASLVVEASTEERALLSELLDVRVERVGRRTAAGELADRLRRAWFAASSRLGPGPIAPGRLRADERRLLEAATAAGVGLALCPGRRRARRRGEHWLVGRERPEVRAAVAAVAEESSWLYPALLAMIGEDGGAGETVRRAWVGGLVS
jgi:hypothetical protein